MHPIASCADADLADNRPPSSGLCREPVQGEEANGSADILVVLSSPGAGPPTCTLSSNFAWLQR